MLRPWYGIRAADLTVNAGNVAVLSESDSELETQNICSVRASVVTINGGTLDISAYKDGISTDQINALAAEQLYIKGGTLSSDCSGNYGVEIITSNKYLTPAFEISGGEVTCMSNFEYDRLYDELSELEAKSGLILSGSPTQKVGYEVLSDLPKERHPSRMLSLDKTKDREALKAWYC